MNAPELLKCANPGGIVVVSMSSQRPGDVLKTNLWTSRNGHFAAWVYVDYFIYFGVA